MPWISIIVWVISFLLAGGTKSGKAGQAALIATGAAIGTYYTVDPSNPNAAFPIFSSDASASIPAASTATVQAAGTAATGGGTVAGVLSTGLQSAGSVLSSWGATGTAEVIGTTAAATGSGVFSALKDVPWYVWAGLAALFITR